MTKTVHFFSFIFYVALLAGCRGGADQAELKPVVTQVRQCSRLYTTEYRLHKIIASESDRRIEGGGFSLGLNVFGDRKIIIPIDATVKGYIDFSNFSEANVEQHDGKLVITLPDPEVMLTATKVDQEGIRQYVTGFRDIFSDAEMAALEKEGRQAVLRDIPGLHIERSARQSAVRMLVPLLAQMGYDESNIVINFRRDFDPEAITRKLN